MSRRSSYSPAQSPTHPARPFSPSPPRENRHTSSRPPSLLFGAPPVGIVAPSTSFSITGLPPTPSPTTDQSEGAGSKARPPSSELATDTGNGFFDSVKNRSRGKEWEGLAENEAEWIRSGGRRVDGMIEGEFVRARNISNKSDPRSDSESSSGSSSPPLGATSLLAALAGASSPPPSSTPSPLPSPSRRTSSSPGSADQSFSSLFNASHPFPTDTIKDVPALRSIRASTTSSPSPHTWNATKLPRLQQPTVIRSTSGRGLAFLPPPAQASPSGSLSGRTPSNKLNGNSRRQSSSSEQYKISPAGGYHPRSVSLQSGDGSPKKSLIPRKVSKMGDMEARPSEFPLPPARVVEAQTSDQGSSEPNVATANNGHKTLNDGRKVDRGDTPSPSQIPRWKAPNLEKRQGSYILGRASGGGVKRSDSNNQAQPDGSSVSTSKDKESSTTDAKLNDSRTATPDPSKDSVFIAPQDADKVPAHLIAKQYESGSEGEKELTLHEVIERSKPEPTIPSIPSSPEPIPKTPSPSSQLPYIPRKKKSTQIKDGEPTPSPRSSPLNATSLQASPTSNALNIQLYAGITRHRTSPLPISAPHLEVQLVWPDEESDTYKGQWFNWVPGRRYIPSWGVRVTL